MAEAAFDTLSMARSLERDYDMPAKQAEGVATLVYTQLSGNVATKDDITRVQKDIAHLDEKMSHEFTKLEQRMTIRLGAIIVASIVFLEALDRLFPVVGG